jgi:hypothetical protein
MRLNINKFKLSILFCYALGTCYAQGDRTITISGRAMDFNGNPIDSCLVAVFYPDFSTAYSAYTNKDGYYAIPNVSKGKYMAIYAIRPKEYPRELKVAEEDMRLEFWAWNVIADRDLTINPRYHRLELYGTTVFKENGGYPSMMIYTRPMSLGRMLSYGQEMWEDKKRSETEEVDISVEPDDIEFKVYADHIPVTIQSVQPVKEYVGGRRQMAYLIYIDLPDRQPDKYAVFRVEAFNRAYGGEKGENVYFYEMPTYESKTK